MIGRRTLMHGAAAVGMTGLLRVPTAQAEPPPETKRIRLTRRMSLCEAPNYVAEDLLRGEGFTDVQYIKQDFGGEDSLTKGGVDISMLFGPPLVLRMDAGEPIVFLAGVHVGCAEVFASHRVKTFRDLKGKPFAIFAPRDGAHTTVAAIAAHVGLDPQRDIPWVMNHPPKDWPDLLAAGKIDGFLTAPPQAQETRARKIGHVILNTTTDRPWSQYFCCMVVARKDFVQRYPVATKRALRAILKASEICAVQPEAVARSLDERGFVKNDEFVVQSLREVPYGKWRDYDPMDAVRFYALRLREAGMIKTSPQKILADGTDWRFLNELKKELKS